MKTVIELLQKPLIKIIGLMLVLYFGLFADKKNPDSLGNRLSSENIKKNFFEAQQKSSFIFSNIDQARKLKGSPVAAPFDSMQNFVAVTVQDSEIGAGDSALKCGDEAEISYDIHVATSNNQLEFISKEKLLIGSNTNALLERKIIGMKSGGVRLINVPRDFKSTNQKLAFLLKFNEADLQYRVTLLQFHASESDAAQCSNDNNEIKKDE